MIEKSTKETEEKFCPKLPKKQNMQQKH